MLVQSRPRKLASISFFFILLFFFLFACIWFQFNDSANFSPWLRTTSKIPVLYEESFDPQPMRSLCLSTEWTPGLYFTCNESVGGIGNVRSSVLHCVRYAFEAGAALIMPNIVLRDANDVSLIRNQERTGIDYMFDVDHFVDSLNLGCPELQIYDTVKDIPNYEFHQDPAPLTPEHLETVQPLLNGLQHPEAWRSYFYKWIEDYSIPSPERPLIVNLARSYLTYPIHHDPQAFHENFGRILRIRDDARRLAAKVLHTISVKYSLNINLSEPVAQNAFYGVHLRTEADAAKAWPPVDWEYQRYERQMELYLQQASRANTSVIYVASGDYAEVERFAKDAKENVDMTVETKFGLLEPRDLAELNSMSWDQQALVDFLVIMKATDFAGISHSSFAWNIALRRHWYSKMEGNKHLTGEQMLLDELSVIYGLTGAYPEYAKCMWP